MISLKNKAQIKFIADFLRPYTKRAYLVGGALRDALLGLELKDFDIEVYDIKPALFEKLMQELGALGVGKSFFVYKYKNYDLALARTENKISYGHKGFKVLPCDDEKLAARRRDFTINSMMINIFDDTFLDFYGGFKDLKEGILRHIHTQSFQEDSLRVLRAVVFASRFDFIISKQTLKLMQEMSIKDLSQERINTELYKIFKSKNLALAYKYLQLLGLEKEIFGYTFKDKNFSLLLKKARDFIDDEALFLYLYFNYFKLDKKSFFEKTQLKKEFLIKANQTFTKRLSDKTLLEISLKMPLKDWLGLYSAKRIQRAKQLKVYDKPFQSKIKATHLLQEGFKGAKLGLELSKRQKQELKNYLKKSKEEKCKISS